MIGSNGCSAGSIHGWFTVSRYEAYPIWSSLLHGLLHLLEFFVAFVVLFPTLKKVFSPWTHPSVMHSRDLHRNPPLIFRIVLPNQPHAPHLGRVHDLADLAHGATPPGRDYALLSQGGGRIPFDIRPLSVALKVSSFIVAIAFDGDLSPLLPVFDIVGRSILDKARKLLASGRDGCVIQWQESTEGALLEDWRAIWRRACHGAGCEDTRLRFPRGSSAVSHFEVMPTRHLELKI